MMNANQTIAAVKALPEFSRSVYVAILRGLYAEPGFSDLEAEDVAQAIDSTTEKVRGALSTLIKAGLVYIIKQDHAELRGGRLVTVWNPFIYASAHDPENDIRDEVLEALVLPDPGAEILTPEGAAFAVRELVKKGFRDHLTDDEILERVASAFSETTAATQAEAKAAAEAAIYAHHDGGAIEGGEVERDDAQRNLEADASVDPDAAIELENWHAANEARRNPIPARGLICERCERELNRETAVMLEYDNSLDLYFDPALGLVPEESSQGGYWFGPDCAKTLREQTNPERIQRAAAEGRGISAAEAEILVRWHEKKAAEARAELEKTAGLLGGALARERGYVREALRRQSDPADRRQGSLPFEDGLDAVAEFLDGGLPVRLESGTAAALATAIRDLLADSNRARRLEETLAADRREASREADDFEAIIGRLEAEVPAAVARVVEVFTDGPWYGNGANREERVVRFTGGRFMLTVDSSPETGPWWKLAYYSLGVDLAGRVQAALEDETGGDSPSIDDAKDEAEKALARALLALTSES